IPFLSDVCPVYSRGIANDRRAGCVVKGVLGAREPEIQPLCRHGPSVEGLNGDAGTVGDYILPAKLIGDAKAVVSRGIHRVKRAVFPVRRVLVAGGIVELIEQARLPPCTVDS